MKNILCTNCNNTGDNVLVYCPDQITPEIMMKGLEKRGFFMSDCYEVKDDELQYYIIDDRLTLTADQARILQN